MNIRRIRHDLHFLSDHEVVLFGSFVEQTFGPRSDIDIAIITRSQDAAKLLQIRIDASGKAPEGYDIQIFESLPLVIKGSILENFEVLFGDPLEIGMYFYHFRKLWEDYGYRLEVPTVEDIRRSIAKDS